MGKPERADLIIIHLAPPNIDSGSALDARNILLYMSEKHRELCESTILITNDKKLLGYLVKKKNICSFKKICYIPIEEIPLYSYRLSLVVSLCMLRHLRGRVVFLMEEYPPILVSLVLLSYIFRGRMIIKYHSYGYLLGNEYFDIVFQSIPGRVRRALYAFMSFLVTFSLRASKDIYLLAPNRDLASTLNRILKRRRAFFISPGNFMDPLPVMFLGKRPATDNKCFCTLSSKIDLLTVKVAQVLVRVFSMNVMLYGKLYGPQEKVVIKSITENSPVLSYEGVFPTREKLLEKMSKSCGRVFYVVTSYETWGYSLYELLSIFGTVVVIFPSTRMMNVITSLYQEIFDGYVSIVRGNYFAVFHLERPIDEAFIENMNKKYVGKVCQMIKSLMV